MKPQTLLAAALAVTLAGCSTPPVNRMSEAPLATQPVDTQAYFGRWNEQARLPNQFERDCVYVTADYAAREDGLISVVNTCRESDGEVRDARGRARVVGDGKLEVSFFGPFWGDYWVLERADDYAWSIVGEPSGRYLWVLTRAESVTPEQRADFERRLTALGYDVSKLVWRGA